MRKLKIEKYYAHCEKLEIKEMDEIDKDSVSALVFEFTNGEVGFLPRAREYAYLTKSKDDIFENWNQIREEYLDTTDFDLTYFMVKDLSPDPMVEEEVERNLKKLDFLFNESGDFRDYSDLKNIAAKIDKYLNEKEYINRQEAWIPVGYLLGEIICEQKKYHWYLHKHSDSGLIRFDIRNDQFFYSLWGDFADYFIHIKRKKKKFTFLNILNSIIISPYNLD